MAVAFRAQAKAIMVFSFAAAIVIFEVPDGPYTLHSLLESLSVHGIPEAPNVPVCTYTELPLFLPLLFSRNPLYTAGPPADQCPMPWSLLPVHHTPWGQFFELQEYEREQRLRNFYEFQ